MNTILPRALQQLASFLAEWLQFLAGNHMHDEYSSDPRTPGHQEKEAVKGDLKENQETLGFVVRTTN
jgi:hypothetical protein